MKRLFWFILACARLALLFGIVLYDELVGVEKQEPSAPARAAEIRPQESADPLQNNRNPSAAEEAGATTAEARQTENAGYITGLTVLAYPTEAPGPLPSGYTNWVRNDRHDPDNGAVLNANDGDDQTGDWIRFAYTLGAEADKHEAVAEIAVLEGQDEPTPAGWIKIDVDLNKGHPNAGYLYLIYRKVDPSDAQAVDFIGSYSGKMEIETENPPDYTWACYAGSNERADLNKGRLTANWVFLTVRKKPFAW